MSTSPASRHKRKLQDSTTISADISKPHAAAGSGAAQPEIGYAVKCSRRSELLEFDDEYFVDMNDDEADDWSQEGHEAAKAADGSWIWDSDPAQATDMVGPTGEDISSFAGGEGKPVFFRDLVAADTAASGVWIALLLGVKRPCRPVLQQLEDQALGPPEKHKSSTHRLRSKESQQTAAAAAAETAAALDAGLAAGDVAACQQLLSYFGQVSADGLAAWQADVEWFDDPFAEPETVKNVVRSTIRVEVVQAKLM